MPGGCSRGNSKTTLREKRSAESRKLGKFCFDTAGEWWVDWEGARFLVPKAKR